MKVLITGATGFIGSHVVKKLSAASWEVRALIRDMHAAAELTLMNVEPVEGDIRDPESIKNITLKLTLYFGILKQFRVC